MANWNIPNYFIFACAYSVYNFHSLIFLDTIYKTAPTKYICIKSHETDNIIELLRQRTNFKNVFLHAKLHVDYENFKKQWNIVQKEIKRRKGNYVKEKLQNNTNNLKELSKAIRNIGIPCKVSKHRFVLENMTCCRKVFTSPNGCFTLFVYVCLHTSCLYIKLLIILFSDLRCFLEAALKPC